LRQLELPELCELRAGFWSLFKVFIERRDGTRETVRLDTRLH
jgi:hypothetical protein